MTEPITIVVVLPPEMIEVVAARAADIVEARRGNQGTPVRSPWLYGAKAAADYLGMPVGRIEKLQARGRIPFHRGPEERRCAYRRDELDRWMAEGSA